MLNIKKAVSICLSAILSVGLLLNSTTVIVLAEKAEDSEVEFQVEVETKAQSFDGTIHELDDSIKGGTTIKVVQGLMTVNLTAEGRELFFKNIDGEFTSFTTSREVDDEENTLWIYDIPLENVNDKLVVQAQTDNLDEQVEETKRIEVAEKFEEIEMTEEDEVVEEIEEVKKAEVIEEIYIELVGEEGTFLQIDEAVARYFSLQEVTDDEEQYVFIVGSEEVVTEEVIEEQDDLAATNNDEESFTMGVFSRTQGVSEGVPEAQNALLTNNTPQMTNGNATIRALNLSTETLSDGEYTIQIRGLNEDDTVHLRNEDLVNPAKLVVTGGKIDVYFASLGRELTFQNSSGGFDNKTISTEAGSTVRSDGMITDNKNNYLVTINSLNEELIVRFAAGGSASGFLTYRIVFDQSTLELVSGGVEENDDSNSDNDNSNTDTATSSGSTGGNGNGSNSHGSNNNTTNTGKTSPKTGDMTNIFGSSSVMIISFSIICILLYKRKKSIIANN